MNREERTRLSEEGKVTGGAVRKETQHKDKGGEGVGPAGFPRTRKWFFFR